MQDVIDRSHKISIEMRKKYEKELKKKKKENKKLKSSSYVDDFIKDHAKELTPAEKGKLTKAKNKAIKENADKIAREKESMERWTIEKNLREKAYKEALEIGSSKSAV